MSRCVSGKAVTDVSDTPRSYETSVTAYPTRSDIRGYTTDSCSNLPKYRFLYLRMNKTDTNKQGLARKSKLNTKTGNVVDGNNVARSRNDCWHRNAMIRSLGIAVDLQAAVNNINRLSVITKMQQ